MCGASDAALPTLGCLRSELRGRESDTEALQEMTLSLLLLYDSHA